MNALVITKDNFQKEVLESKVPVLVDFWASWCGPCQMLLPVIEDIAASADGFKVGKINVDEQMSLAQQFGISTIPTLIVFKDGQIVNKSVGVRPKEAILGMLK